MTAPEPYDIAIIGYGFSGAMVLANLAKLGAKNLRIAICDGESKQGKGAAYGTKRPEHLLNVRAGNMGAFEGEPWHFYDWLQTAEGKAASIKAYYTPTPESFAPRVVYGEYIASLEESARKVLLKNNCFIEFFGEAKSIQKNDAFTITLDTQKNITAVKLVLATGNLFPAKSPELLTLPWQADFEKIAKSNARNVAIIGTGLTAVDTILSLLAVGFQGRILAISRRALFPAMHIMPQALTIDWSDLLGKRLSQILQHIRGEIKKHDAPWQAVIDSLRGITPKLWKSLPLADQKHFLSRYMTLWNVHRHRMAPEIHAQLQAAIESGQLQSVQAGFSRMTKEGSVIVRNGKEELLKADVTFQCMGPSYRALPECITPLMQEGLEKHANGAGLKADADCQASPDIFAMSNLLLGERLECTAVPELRVQAATIAKHLI